MMQPESHAAKLLRDARAEIARPTRPETPRDSRRAYGSARGLLDMVRGGGSADFSASSAVAGLHASGLPVVMTKLPPLAATTTASGAASALSASAAPPPVSNAAAMQTRTATANSATGSVAAPLMPFSVRPPPASTRPQQQLKDRNTPTTTLRSPAAAADSAFAAQQQQQQQQQQQDENIDIQQPAVHETEARLRRRNSKQKQPQTLSDSSDCGGVSDADASVESTASSKNGNGAVSATSADQQAKFKQLILHLEPGCEASVRAKAAADILALLQWSEGGGDGDSDRLRTRALEVALELFRDNGDVDEDGDDVDGDGDGLAAAGDEKRQQQRRIPAWIAARNANLIDTALRFVECRPFGSVDFTVAVSCVKTAAEIPDCVDRVFTAGGIRVLKQFVLDAAIAKIQPPRPASAASSAAAVSPIALLCVAMALQTLSFLSERYSAQIVRCGVCEPCCDLAPFLEDDDRAAAALCSLAAKLTAVATAAPSDDGSQQQQQQPGASAVACWREYRYGVFGQRLCRCVLKRWGRVRDGSAKITGCTLVPRGLLAIAMHIADGGTPLDVVAAEGAFLAALCEEFDEMAAQMNPACPDDSEALVNALRVIAGVSVNSAGGHALAAHPSLKELVSDLLLEAEPTAVAGRQVLLLTLVCVSNFTFYCFQPSSAYGGNGGGSDMERLPSGGGDEDSAARDGGCSTPVTDSVAVLWLESLLPSLLGILFSDDSSPEALVEATRALGNISRTSAGCAACRQHRIDEVVCALLIHADPRIVYNCLGVVTNLSAIAINEGAPRSALPWLSASTQEQVHALAEGKSDFGEFPEVAELAQAARSNIEQIE